ncbi:MAG: GFA family protein, partial [Nitrospirota bacterium]|nr:GFA family protein [Nitrospirota bacterium]
KHCGSALYVFDPSWPDLLHPFASAVDTPLPRAPETVHIMLDSKPDWVEAPAAGLGGCYGEYPEQSIEDWHKSRDLWEA